ncbi:MAG TPA: hypothetical protein VEK15_05690 [Vicinamibacteria bacterium]|nr:hypothetical protein [Vicinamibacteria bacterium]
MERDAYLGARPTPFRWATSRTILVLLCLLGACQPNADVVEVKEEATFLDPVMADGEHYALEFENDYVRVLRENLAAGEGGAMHSHRPRVSVYLRDAQVELTPRGGEPVETQLVAGTTSWGDATTHQGVVKGGIVENLSIELQDLEGGELPAPELDAVGVDPDHHIVLFENDRVRVVRFRYPPGWKTPLHQHRPGFGVALTDLRVRNVFEQGEAAEIQRAAGSTFWTEDPRHESENLSSSELVVIFVELKKRPG